MSKLYEMIAEMCPDGVEYCKVGDVCTTITDYTAAGSFADIAKNVKYISNGIGYAQLIRTTDLKSAFQKEDKFVYVDEHAYNYLWRVNLDSEALVLPNVGNCGEVYYITPDIFPLKHNVLGPNAILVKSSVVSIRFLYHLLLSKEFQNKLTKIISTTGQTKFNKTNFKELTIPVPPLPVQSEIVRILDNFMELIAELTAELTARRIQYEYYLESMIVSCSDTRKVKLNEVCDIYDGTHQTPKYTNSGVKFVSVENINNLYETTKFISEEAFEKYKIKPQVNDVFMTRITAGVIGKCTVVDRDEPLAYYVSLALLRPKSKVLDSKYLKYYIESGYGKKELRKFILTDATPPKINKDAIGKVTILIPSLEEQQRVVSVIEKFNTLCNDISTGLPAEIEARKKQYEYYRDKLLTFKELS